MPGDSRGTVLVISPSIGIGGREKIAINTVRSFESLGYRTVLVFFQRRDTEYPFHGESINLDVPASNNTLGRIIAQIRRTARLLRLRRQYNVKCVFSLGEAANISNVLSGFAHRGKTLIAVHGSGEVKKNWFSKFIFSKADRVVCIAQDMRHQLLSLYPDLRHVTVIENGYDLAPVEQTEKETTSSLRLVTMGRLTRVKGFDRLIGSMKIISDSIPNAILTIIGGGELESELKELTARLGLENAVVFQGYLSDPFPVLQAQDIYALTSLEEGFPNALIEALNCGLPIVATDCPTGPREILSAHYTPENVHGIQHEKYGVLVENSPDAFEERFAQAVIQLWNNKEEMETYRLTAPERAKEFSLEKYQEKLGNLINE